jgi:hypothetical protein
MKPTLHFFTTPTGQLVAVGILAAGAMAFVAWQRAQRPPAVPKAPAPAASAALLPKVFHRPGARFEPPVATPSGTANSTTATPPKPSAPAVLPLAVFARAEVAANMPIEPAAPYGRLVPCETVVTLESNRLDTPVIGLVTEDVFENGRCVIPAGTEVHGRAALDRTRERLAVTGSWVLVWREPGPDRGRELRVQGLALDRERDPANGAWGRHDGSAGLRGELIRADTFAEAKLFAATFLASATNALQDTRASASAFGESLVPAATARNASLAGTSAILREYAQQIRESIVRDGFYLRVPAGKPFYLYVTEPLLAAPRHTNAPARHETR